MAGMRAPLGASPAPDERPCGVCRRPEAQGRSLRVVRRTLRGPEDPPDNH